MSVFSTQSGPEDELYSEIISVAAPTEPLRKRIYKIKFQAQKCKDKTLYVRWQHYHIIIDMLLMLQ